MNPASSPLCPRCCRALRAVGTRRQADVCPAGHGAFLRPEELDRALGPAHARALVGAARGSPLPGAACPACEVAMREVRFRGSDLVVDGCARCGGFWFGPGESARIRDEGLAPQRHAVAVLPALVRRAALGLRAASFLRR